MALIYQGKGRVLVEEAVLHCAAIKSRQFAKMSAFEVFAEVNRWHLTRRPPFKNGFGYHGLFMPDGEFYPGRPYGMIGAHVAGHNSGTLGFLLIESREITEMGTFDDWFTEAQRRAVRRHLAQIDGLKRVRGHNYYAPKLCPGFRVNTEDWL